MLFGMCAQGTRPRVWRGSKFCCIVHPSKASITSATEARQQLGLTKVQSRRTLHLAQYMFKSIKEYRHHPTYVSELFSTACHHHNSRNLTNNINIPLKKSGLGQRAFSFTGTSLWRSLLKRQAPWASSPT